MLWQKRFIKMTLEEQRQQTKQPAKPLLSLLNSLNSLSGLDDRLKAIADETQLFIETPVSVLLAGAEGPQLLVQGR